MSDLDKNLKKLLRVNSEARHLEQMFRSHFEETYGIELSESDVFNDCMIGGFTDVSIEDILKEIDT